MPDDQNTSQNPTPEENSVLASHQELTEPADIPPVASESPREAPTPVPVEDQNGAVNSVSSSVQTSTSAPNFLHDLLLRERTKIQDKKKKKLDKIIEKLAVKNKISNDDAQKLLYVSDEPLLAISLYLNEKGR